MDKQSWAVKRGEDDSFWTPLDEDVFPVYIVRQYDMLRDIAKKGNVYGLLLQIKDLYEIVIKTACIIALSLIDISSVGDVQDKQLEKIFSLVLGGNLSMGSWADLARRLAVCRKLDDDVVKNLVGRTCDLFNARIGNTDNIVNWRNATIGHGKTRSEDSAGYEKECEDAIRLLKDYFSDDRVTGAYSQLYFTAGGHRVSGWDFSEADPLFIVMQVGNRAYIPEYMCVEDRKCYFFDSYNSSRKRPKFISYIEGSELHGGNDKQAYFLKLFDTYCSMIMSMDDAVTAKYQYGARDEAMKYLADDEDYVKPTDYLTGSIQKVLEEKGSGIILVEMERGMGKTAFSLHADGNYKNGSLFRDAAVRTYILSDANYRGIRDFEEKSFEYLRRMPADCDSDRYNSGMERNRYTDKAELLAYWLNEFNDMCTGEFKIGEKQHDIRQTEISHSIYILDGIDELTKKTKDILSYIPQKEALDDGAFLILTSRCPDEADISPESREYIKQVESIADAVIRVDRDNTDYRAGLGRFLEKILPGRSGEEYQQLLAKADYRFLRCKLFRYADPDSVLLSDRSQSMAEAYLNYISEARNSFARKELMDFLSAISVMGSISLDDYSRLIRSSDITFRMIGCINDALPLLTVERKAGGNSYRWASDEYRKFFIERYATEVHSLIEDSKYAVSCWCDQRISRIDSTRSKVKASHNAYAQLVEKTYHVSMGPSLEDMGNDQDYMDFILEHEFYLDMYHSMWKLAEDLGSPQIFLSGGFFGLYCKSIYSMITETGIMAMMSKTRLMDVKGFLDKYPGYYRTFIDVLIYLLSNSEYDTIIENIRDIQRMSDGFYSKARDRYDIFIDSVLTRFIADKNPKWLDLIFQNDSDQTKLNEGYARKIKAAGLMDILIDSMEDRAESILNNADSFGGWVSIRTKMGHIIDGILAADPDDADKKRLQELLTRERRF